MAKRRIDPHALAATAPAANPTGNPQPFSTKESRSHNNNGHSFTTGLHGTTQKYDDGSVITEATESLNAFRKNPELDGKLTAFWRRVQQANTFTVQQGNYSYQGRQLALSMLYQRIDGIPPETPPGFEGTPIRPVKATQFGKFDREDEGTGSPFMGLIQTNSEVFGGSVKISIMEGTFGANWKKNEKRLRAMIEVFFPDKKRMVRVPLVDVGPGEHAPSGAEVDLTWACDQFLGTQGGAAVQYRLLLPSA